VAARAVVEDSEQGQVKLVRRQERRRLQAPEWPEGWGRPSS